MSNLQYNETVKTYIENHNVKVCEKRTLKQKLISLILNLTPCILPALFMYTGSETFSNLGDIFAFIVGIFTIFVMVGFIFELKKMGTHQGKIELSKSYWALVAQGITVSSKYYIAAYFVINVLTLGAAGFTITAVWVVILNILLYTYLQMSKSAAEGVYKKAIASTGRKI